MQFPPDEEREKVEARIVKVHSNMIDAKCRGNEYPDELPGRPPWRTSPEEHGPRLFFRPPPPGTSSPALNPRPPGNGSQVCPADTWEIAEVLRSRVSSRGTVASNGERPRL